MPVPEDGEMTIPEQDSFAIPAAPADLEERTGALLAAFDERILVMDGATGTALQGTELGADVTVDLAEFCRSLVSALVP